MTPPHDPFPLQVPFQNARLGPIPIPKTDFQYIRVEQAATSLAFGNLFLLASLATATAILAALLLLGR
jgi:hypothetical protein